MVYYYLIVLWAHACCLCAGADTVNFQDQEFDTSDPN